jgi:hypothetical protein
MQRPYQTAMFDCPVVQFVEELGKLQDRVPAFSADKAAAIIEADLGQPVSKLFRSFDTRPIAAASLGQVRFLCFRGGGGTWFTAMLFSADLLHCCPLVEQGSDSYGVAQGCG